MKKMAVKKSYEEKIYGKTIIDHKIRTKLNLDINEYVLLDVIEILEIKKVIFTSDDIYRMTGIQSNDVLYYVKRLKNLEFITKRNNLPLVTDKWKKAFEISDNEFDTFWFKDGKPAWTGSKKDAKKKYALARKNNSTEYLLQQRDYYFTFLAHPENNFRQKMGCSVFLNLDKERFKEPWEIYLKELRGTKEKKEVKKLGYSIKQTNE